MVSQAVRLSSFVVIPMLLGLFAVADTLVLALLGEQWMVCVPFLRIMCISYCFWPVHIANLQAINAVGRSDIFLKLEIIKKALSLVALAVGMQFDVMVFVSLKAVQDFLCTFVNGAPNRKLLGYSIARQWRDVAPAAVLSAVMCGLVMAAGGSLLWLPVWLRLAVQILWGIAVYTALAWVFRLESFRYLWELAVKRRQGN